MVETCLSDWKMIRLVKRVFEARRTEKGKQRRAWIEEVRTVAEVRGIEWQGVRNVAMTTKRIGWRNGKMHPPKKRKFNLTLKDFALSK